MNDSIVIIPTYNEIENVEKIIRATLSQHKSFHILIIDDNSPDHTADKVALLQEEYPGRLFLEKRKEKSGLGTDSSGRYNTSISSFLKWMLISLIIQMI